MSDELELALELEQQTAIEVIRLYAQSETPAEIQQKTGVPPRKQKEFIKQWQTLQSRPQYIEERGKQLVGELDEGFKSILRRLEKVYDEACAQDDYKQQTTILKEMANIRKMSAEVYMKAGVISNQNIGDQIADAEEKIAAVEQMLVELTEEFPMIKTRLIEKLSILEGKVAPTKVVGEDL